MFSSLKMSRLLFLLIQFILLLQIYPSNAQTNIERRTKLCADPKCTEDLFPSLSIRDYLSQDPQFLQHKQNSSLKVFAFKFSNRPDFMEAETEDKIRGYIYNGHIDLEPYVVFLESALKTNKTLFMVDQENGKLIREVSAIPELARDYSAYALKIEGYPLDKELVAKLMQLEQQPNAQHKHSHGHGHSHEHRHQSGNDAKNVKDDSKENPKTVEIVQPSTPTPAKKEEEEPKAAPILKGKTDENRKEEEPKIVENIPPLTITPSPKIKEEAKVAEIVPETTQLPPIPIVIEKTEENTKDELKIVEIVPSILPPLTTTPSPAIKEEANTIENVNVQPSATTESPSVQIEVEKTKENANEEPPMSNVPLAMPPPQPIIMEKEESKITENIQPSTMAPTPPMKEEPKMVEIVPETTQLPPPILMENSKEKDEPTIAKIIPSILPPLTTTPSPPIAMESMEKTANEQKQQKLPEKVDFGDSFLSFRSSDVQAENIVQEDEKLMKEKEEKITTDGIETHQKPPLDLNAESEREKINYCFKEDCQVLDQIPSAEDKNLPIINSSAIHQKFRETMFTIRAVLPEPMCHFEDSGLIMLAAVLILTFIHFMLRTKSSGPEPFDHRLLHDCITRLKEQELVIEQQRTKMAENQHLMGVAKIADQLQKENKILAEKLKTADRRNAELESDNEQIVEKLKAINRRNSELESDNDRLNEKLKAADWRNSELELDNERMKKSLSERDEEVVQNRKKIESLTTILDERNAELKEMERLRQELAEKDREFDKRELDRYGLTQECAKMLQMIEEKERKMEHLSSVLLSSENTDLEQFDLQECITQLKEQELVIEQQRTKMAENPHLAGAAKVADQMQKENKILVEKLKTADRRNSELESNLEKMRQEIAEKDRESEKRELDRHQLTQQCTKLLQMIEEKERKMEHSEQERERIRTRLSDVELELRKVEDAKREMQHRLKEVEQSLKKSEELNGRLENKLYHEERRFNTKIRQLEELSLAKKSVSPVNLSGGGMSSDLNMSGNSSDREFINVECDGPTAGGGREGDGNRSGVPSLWSEIDATEPIEELVQLERQGGSMRRRRSIRTYGEISSLSHRNSPYLSDHLNGREERLINTSKYSSTSAAATAGMPAPRQRMRSRSVGRQSARLTGVSSASTATPFYGTLGHSSASLYNTSASLVQRDRASVVPMLARTRRSRMNNNEEDE